ncbi:hypothetical protein CLAIMM_10060 [Cladophialophora immunda]|nr:hypothetical protein CLAIMM_10060 [Cladophialophora immunda]
MLAAACLACVALFAVFQPLLSYLNDAKHLRKFPAPSYAAFSSLWRIRHNINKRHFVAIHQAHRDLGTHVRIAPNHISISDPKAMNDIYGHGANFLKDAWYDGGAGEHRNMGDTRVKAEHQAKRKMFAHVFAQKTIASLEPVVTQKAAMLVHEIDRKAEAGQEINIRRYLNYFTIDLITELLYGESLGCLERGDDVVDAETREGKLYKTGLIQSLHRAMSINTALGFEAPLLPYTKKLFAWHPYRRAGADFENIVYHNTMKRLRNAAAGGGGGGDDFFQRLMVNSRGERLDLSMGEILAECGVIMNAGSDTTTAALTGTIFLLYKNPRVLAKLREELDPVMRNRDVPLYDSVAHLPYLRACIEESLRVRPASTMGLPRVVPAGGRMIAGKFIDEGVTVSVPTYTLLRDPEAFENPDVFDPDRWINGDRTRMSKAHLPFSIGPRACIGRNIAYFEQIILIATLTHLYDFELPSADFELGVIERLNANPDELIVKCRRRPTTRG